eukprot:6212389-Pleurochrysis_carterae.AAC.5
MVYGPISHIDILILINLSTIRTQLKVRNACPCHFIAQKGASIARQQNRRLPARKSVVKVHERRIDPHGRASKCSSLWKAAATRPSERKPTRRQRS